MSETHFLTSSASVSNDRESRCVARERVVVGVSVDVGVVGVVGVDVDVMDIFIGLSWLSKMKGEVGSQIVTLRSYDAGGDFESLSLYKRRGDMS
jgi:hypothetical protein